MSLTDKEAKMVGRGAGRVRTDAQTGVREVVELYGADDRRIFGFTHLPPRAGRAGVLVCSPLHAEFQTNYRREVLLGRALASRGLAVHRFHYMGAGNSGGSSEGLSFGSMLDDAFAARDQLIGASGVSVMGFLGTRFGALVASTVASSLEGAPLALWAPLLNGERYFTDMFRAKLIYDLKEGTATGRSREDLVEELRRAGVLDVLGYSVHLPLYETSLDRTLASSIGDRRRPVLIVQLGRRDALAPELLDLVTELERRGCVVEGRAIPANEAGWFSNEPTRAAPISKRIVDATADWFVTAFAGSHRGG
jgi:alpha/beta superfamily hydrolase